MDTSVYSDTGPENDPIFRKALADIRALYKDTPGGKHARLAAFQRDMFGLCEDGYLVPVQAPGYVHYYQAGNVPEGAVIMSLAELRETHREQLRVSAAKWN